MADPTSATDARFDAAVARSDPAMAVVTVAAGRERDGCLVGFHGQASIGPRRYVVWLSVANRTHDLAARATHLGVHLLGAGDHDLAERFGGATGDELPDGGDDKLAGLAWAPGPGGAPMLERVPVRFAGRIVEWLRPAEGDHHAAVLEPVEVAPGAAGEGIAAPLRLGAAADIDPGHPA